VICDPFCVAIRPATGSGCAVWCYGASNTPGRAKATSDAICQNACPYGTSATWQ
jgi:hypothetical protein